MKNSLEFEKIQHIIEKLERWEKLDAKEKAFGDIIEALQKQKNQTVLLDKDFQDTLKQELMKKYDELYGRVSWLDKFFALRRSSVVGFVYTYCVVLVCILGTYGGLYILQSISSGGHRFPNQVNTISSTLPSNKSESSNDYFSGPKHSGGIQFGWSNSVTYSAIQGSSDDFAILDILEKHAVEIAALMVSLLTTIVIVRSRKKK